MYLITKEYSVQIFEIDANQIRLENKNKLSNTTIECYERSLIIWGGTWM